MKSLDLELNLDTGKFTGRMQQAGRETQKFERNVSGLNQELSKTDAKAKMAFGGLGAGIVVLGNLRSALENTRFFFTGLATAATNATAEIEKTFFLLKGMSKADTGAGKIAEATSNLEYLMTKAKEAPFSIQAMSDSFVKFKAGGVDPLAGGFQALLDATAAFGGNDEVFKRASVAIQQMGGKGVVSMEELRQQLGEAVPTAINMMANGLGVTYEELVKQIEKGKVRAQPALKAMFEEMEKTYGGSAQRMMETYQGRVAQLKSSLLELSLAFTGMGTDGQTTSGGFYDTLKTSIEGLSNVFTDPAFQENVGQFGQNIGIAANALTMMVSALGQITAFIPALGNLSLVMGTLAAVLVAKFGGAGAAAMKKFFIDQTSGIRTVIAAERELDAQRKASAAAELTAANKATENATRAVNEGRAKIASRQQEVAALQAQIAKTEALIAAEAKARLLARNGVGGSFIASDKQADSLARQEKLTKELTTAKVRLQAQEAMLTRATVAQTAAEGQLANATRASKAATDAHALALGLKARVVMGLSVAMGALKGAMAFLGGPWGIAIMAIAGAFTYLASQNAKAKASMEEVNRSLKDIESFADQARKSVTDLSDKTRDNAKASGEAKAAADSLKSSYDGIATAAQNAAEWVKYLTATEREEQLVKFRGLKGDTTKAVQKAENDYLRTVNRGATYAEKVRLANAEQNGDQASLAQIRDEIAMRLATTPVGAEIRAKQAVIREAQEADSATGDTLTQLQRARGTATLEKPKPVEAQVTAAPAPTPSASTSGGGSKTPKVSDVQKALSDYAERTVRIREEMGGAATEAAKMAAEISDGKFKNETKAVQDQLMAAATAMDELVKKQKGAEAFKKMKDDLASSTQEAGILDQQIKGVLGGQTEAAQESAKFRVNMVDAAKLAEAAGISTAEMVDQLVAADAATRRKNAQLSAAEDLQRSLRENTQGAADAWDDYIAGTSTSTREAARLQRQLNRLTETFAGNPEELAKAQKIAADAFMEDRSRRAAERAGDLRREMDEINLGLSGYSQAQRNRIALDRESKRVYDEVVLATVEGTTARKNAEQAYYGWKAAKERELAAKNPLADMAFGWADMMGNMTEAFAGFSSELVDGLAEGNLAFEDFAKGMIKQLLKIILQALIAKAILTALGLSNPVAAPTTGGSFSADVGTGASNFSSGVDWGSFGKFHTGGIVGGQGNASRSISGADFSNMVRYHTGGIAGLKPKEVPAVLQEGEGVFTREQMANLAPAGGNAPVVKIEVINESGTPMDAQQQGGGPRFDGKEYVIGVVLDAVSKPGKMRDAFKGATRS